MKFGSITTGIVSDGLVFNMDAANRASYIPDATTSYNTTDLSVSGSFINDPTYISPPTSASCWDFDGVDDYIDVSSINLGLENTISFWIKRGGITTGTAMTSFDTEADDDNQFKIRFNDNGTLTVESKVSDHNDSLITTQLFRDPSAWMNFVIAFDTTQSTVTNRVKIYVNGTPVSVFGTSNYPAQNLNTLVNAANKLYVGTSAQTDAYCDMYIEEFCLISI